MDQSVENRIRERAYEIWTAHGCVHGRADQHDRKRSFRAFTLDGVDFFIFEQRRRQVTEFRVVLDDQYGAMFLLCLPHDRAPP